jgi:fatty acid desaturase
MPSPFGPWLNLNFNYHIAHHLYPAVHWSKLEKAHAIMAEIDPSIGDVSESELKQNIQMRRQPLRKALSKFYDYQRAQVAV